MRRYLYLRTGKLAAVVCRPSHGALRADSILVARKDRLVTGSGLDPQLIRTITSLTPQSYWIKTVSVHAKSAKRPALLVVGGDDSGTLYAVYRFAEILGARFYLDRDVVPDQQTAWIMPELDEKGAPLFALRGIQPFHDFPEGPDWWDRDEYLAVLGQLPKLRMNFFGLHTYPENAPNAEPTVWIGQAQDVGPGGAVKFSYPSSYQNTLRGNWGYTATKTSHFVFGSRELFEEDAYGPAVMGGLLPAPTQPGDCNTLFNRTAAMLRDAFRFAHQVGVKTCVGTETPLTVPKLVQERFKAGTGTERDLAVQLLYEGIFQRIMQAYPLDYYWFWTPEGWTWSAVKESDIRATTNDLFAAIAAHGALKPSFGLATCGWVLGPQQDRAMFDKILPKSVAVSCINRQVGYTPVDRGFAEVSGRGKWAIPWMEDDPALSSPQLWVGRMRRDAADALRYGCDGLMGIHWRTRVLGPNVAALAHAAWEQKPWADFYQPEPPPGPKRLVAGPVGGQIAGFPNNPIAGTDDPALYQTVRYNLSSYHIAASNGPCRVTLKFSEPHYDAPGKRVFDVKVQGFRVISNLDIFAQVGKNKALDFTFTNVMVTNGWLTIDFTPVVEFPSIAAIDVAGEQFSAKINCGGPAYRDYAADLQTDPEAKQVYAPTADFYNDWAAHEFGAEAGAGAARIFQKVDCHLPVPSVWTDGPGGIQPDARPWDKVKADYAFVDELAAMRLQVRGVGNVERFDYWLNTFLYVRAIAQVNCAWGEYNRVVEPVKAEKDFNRRKLLAQEEVVPARKNLLKLVEMLYNYLLATVRTPGELGTVANWNQHNLPMLLTKPGEELAGLLGGPLPAELEPPLQYHGPTRIIVPAKRTLLAQNEPLRLKIIILSEMPPRRASLYWRQLGHGKFQQAPLGHIARAVYRAELPSSGNEDIEYYIRVEPAGDKPLYFPATAPKLNETVVRYGNARS